MWSISITCPKAQDLHNQDPSREGGGDGGCCDVVGVGDGNILPDDSVNKPWMETCAPYRAASWSFISSLDE